MYTRRKILLIIILLVFILRKLNSQDGYCMINGTTTGGSGGSIVTVTNASDLIKYATSSSPYVIKISGTITLTSRLDVTANKTIEGVNGDSKIVGNICIGVNNVIVRYLTITNPLGYGLGDGISIWGGTHVWVDHVTFYDCVDGCLDITNGADYITVSYCKFYYVNQTDHRFVMILGNTAESDKYHVTIHHCWFASRCDQRMPSGSYSNAHIYNNYFNCNGNYYCTNARTGAKWLVENNYYDGVNNPCYYQDGGIMKITGNIYNNCTGLQYTISNGTVTVPYLYSKSTTSRVPDIVKSSAGNILKSTSSLERDENNSKDIFIYPIPAKDGIITIEINSYNSNFNYILDVYELNGKKLLSKLILSSKSTIVTGLKKGNYIVSIRANDEVVMSKKIIIE